MNIHCPLCTTTDTLPYHQDKNRSYFRCSCCSLVFVPEEFHVNEKEEKRIYDLHENDPYDPGYRRFLSRLSEPLIQELQTGDRGLDFGCGPGPALAIMLREKGFPMDLFDIYYQRNQNVFQKTYDFICATEVFEHLKNPTFEIERLLTMLKDGGTLAVMTKLVRDRQAFIGWHYIQDSTHIIFFSKETFFFLGRRYSCSIEFVDNDVIFIRKG